MITNIDLLQQKIDEIRVEIIITIRMLEIPKLRYEEKLALTDVLNQAQFDLQFYEHMLFLYFDKLALGREQ